MEEFIKKNLPLLWLGASKETLKSKAYARHASVEC